MRRVRGLSRISLSYNILPLFSADASIYVSFSPSYFFREVEEAENRGATAEELKTLLGKGRAKKGMFEGDLDNGELEIGQVASLFREQQTAAEIVHDIVTEYRNLLNESKEKLSI